MGFVYLPNIEDVVGETDPKKQQEQLINTVGIILKSLKELNGYISGTNIRAGSIQAEKLSVDELSAITANMGKLTSGEIYGAYISTSENSYPRAEMDNQGNFYSAKKDAYHSVYVESSLSGVPAIRFYDQTLNHFATLSMDDTIMSIVSAGVNVSISASGGSISISGSDLIVNGRTGTSGTYYVASTPGGSATTPITFNNGIRTS